MKNEAYGLIQSYVLSEFNVSTAYRESSTTIPDLWYFETIVWEWDAKEKKRGRMIDTHDSGSSEVAALASHAHICHNLLSEAGR